MGKGTFQFTAEAPAMLLELCFLLWTVISLSSQQVKLSQIEQSEKFSNLAHMNSLMTVAMVVFIVSVSMHAMDILGYVPVPLAWGWLPGEGVWHVIELTLSKALMYVWLPSEKTKLYATSEPVKSGPDGDEIDTMVPERIGCDPEEEDEEESMSKIEEGKVGAPSE